MSGLAWLLAGQLAFVGAIVTGALAAVVRAAVRSYLPRLQRAARRPGAGSHAAAPWYRWPRTPGTGR